ncbi:class I SAM-dependent DNA methyltransferase [Streptomyces sulphureus]|uniref:class I SAM-dependent DNA methyltransferase n=1 Tax=Streptomyces sulphureus TaxID=47758 RepID=UPI000475BAAA|nr:class I SAM-dependent methyltransferase [Streptomyces sulphureus]
MDDDGFFPADVAARYDEETAVMSAPAAVEPAVEVLAELAGESRAVEFGVGTGRLALPLAARGVPVHGIDLSRAMAERLRAKPGGADVGVTIGDFATVRAAGRFGLAYLVFNTVNNLTTQDAQVACFRNAAAHLAPGGCFLVEVGVPALRLLPPGQRVVPFHVSEEGWSYDVYDTATQAMTSHHVMVGADGGGRHRAIPFRYVWPAELDLMARLAGMRLRHRWADWSRAPFTSESEGHVSVWEKPPE